MSDLRKAAEMALDALDEINKLSVGEKAICLPAEIDDTNGIATYCAAAIRARGEK